MFLSGIWINLDKRQAWWGGEEVPSKKAKRVAHCSHKGSLSFPLSLITMGSICFGLSFSPLFCLWFISFIFFWFLGKWLWHQFSPFAHFTFCCCRCGSRAKINLHLKFNLMRCVHKRSFAAPSWPSCFAFWLLLVIKRIGFAGRKLKNKEQERNCEYFRRSDASKRINEMVSHVPIAFQRHHADSSFFTKKKYKLWNINDSQI